jgi:hypothetical protein
LYTKCFDDTIYSCKAKVCVAKSDDDDLGKAFVRELRDEVMNIYNKFKFPKKMIFSEDDKKNFDTATTCHICNGSLNNDRVRDHCHLTGKYRGAAHNTCNINYKIPKFIPVILHNLSGYDSHLFIKKLGTDGKINCIPTNEEKYISFSKQIVVDEYKNKEGKTVKVTRELRFLDSFRFMASSLDVLANNLISAKCGKCKGSESLSSDCEECRRLTFEKGCKNCKNLMKYFNHSTDEQKELLLRKGVYPYEYVDSVARFGETELPPKTAFYSNLNKAGISDEDYKHAKTVWDAFDCRTLTDFHVLYNISDVLLLADIFENFRDVCMEHYQLDPAWYYTSPGLAWDACLKMTKVELQLLSDYEMILMIRHGIRGGVSTIAHRYAKANNKYMGDAFNPNVESNYIVYFDANNLYGEAMSKPLPTGGFVWMTADQLLNWKTLSEKDGVGCMLEVDLEYAHELHELHNDYPLAPESIKTDKVLKLIPNLNSKQHYVVHYENLKLYESLGLKITNVHRGLMFQESSWLKQYVDLNTSLRAAATNKFEEEFFKLMNNAVFGKTMENIENRVDIRLVSSREEGLSLSAKPNYDRTTIFDENLIAVHMKRTTLKYNKPIYLGFCILDLSKITMYSFHYNFIRRKFKDAKLLFTDTDSLMYDIKTEDFFEDIAGDLDLFDTSNYPREHKYYSVKNKKVIGKFKDEAGSKIIEEFVGLRSKLYSYRMFGLDSNKLVDHKKCKGVKKSVVKNEITHDDYKDCLFSRKEQYRKMNIIRSHTHDIYSEEINKVALSADDDKRIIRGDQINTYAYGHFKCNIK